MADKKGEPKILIDSDVIRHFIDGGKILEMHKIFPRRLVIIDVVKEELCRSKKIKPIVLNFISFCKIEEVDLDDNYEALMEYAKLIKTVGEGEAACMALAKVENKYIASSNLSDIKEYCIENGIKIITTMDFLYEALMNQLYTDEECDKFINDVLVKGNRLPTRSIAEYVKNFKMKKK